MQGRQFADPDGMAARIARHDWTSTPLGPIEHWPERLRAAVDLMLSLPQPGYIGWGPSLVSLYNDAYVPVLGSKHPDALGRPYHAIWPELDPQYRAALDATLAGHAQMFVDEPMRLMGRGRDTSWFTFSWTPLHDADGRVGGFLTIGLEVTEGALARQALRDSERRLAAVFEALPVGVGVLGSDGHYALLNPEMRRFLPTGVLPSRDPVRLHRWRGWADDGTRLAPDQFPGARAMRGEHVVPGPEMRYTQDDGREIWIRVGAVPLPAADGGIAGVVNVVQDIDAIKRGSEAQRLNAVRQHFLLNMGEALRPFGDPADMRTAATRVLGEHLGDVRVQYWDVDADGAHLATAGGYARGLSTLATRLPLDAFGLRVRQALTAGRTQVVDDVATDATIDPAARDAYAGLGVRAFVAVPLVKEARLVAVLAVHRAAAHAWRADEVALAEETAERTWAAIERARAEQRMRLSENRLRIAVESSGVGTWVWYPATDHSECDERTCELRGYPPGTANGLTLAFEQRIHPDDMPGYTAAVQRAIDPAGDGRLRHELRVRLPDGRLRWLEDRGCAQFGPDGAALYLAGTTEDITARKRREADLAFIAEFERQLVASGDPDQTARDAAAAITRHFDATHCLLVDVDAAAQVARVGWDATDGLHGDLRGEYYLPDSRAPWEIAALRAGRPVVLDDVARDCDPARAAELQGYGVRALATLPCVRDGDWVFAISVQHERPHAWDDAEIALLRQLVDRLWLRLERARADEARRELEAERGFLLELSDRLRPLSDPADIQAAATALLRERFDAGWCYYADYDESTRRGVVLRDAVRPGLASLVGVHDIGDAPQFFEAMRAGGLLDVPDYVASALFSPRMIDLYAGIGLRSLLGAPLVKEGRLVAMLLMADTQAHPWSEAARRLVVGVAERTWAAIERARAEDEREAARLQVARQTRFIEAMLGSLPDYAYAFDREHRFAYTNRKMQSLFGLTAEGMAGRTFADLQYPPDLAEQLDAHIDHILRTGETVEGEVFYTSPTGVAAWFHFAWGPVFDDDGNVELVVGTSRDTTQRRHMEERIRAGEQWQAFLVRLGDTLRGLTEPAAIGREALRLLGTQLGLQRVLLGVYEGVDVRVEHEYVDGLPSIAGRYPHAAFGTSMKSLFRAGEPLVVEDVATDPRFDATSRRRYAQAGIAALVGVGLFEDGRVAAAFGAHSATPRRWQPDEVALVREVGERTWAAMEHASAEAALAYSERRFAAIFANASVGLSEIDPSGRFVRINDELCRILDRDANDVLGRNLLELTHPEDVPRTLESIDRARDTGATARLEKRYLRGDGSPVWAESSVTPFRTHDGLPGNLLAVTVDLTERKAADAAREESERLLRQFSDASSDVLWIRDAASLRWEYLSPAYAQIYGDSLAEATAHGELQHWTDHIVEDDRDHAVRHMARVRGGEQVTFEYRIRRVADGAVRWIRDTAFPLFDPDGRVLRIGGIGHDVTDIKSVQSELATSEERMRGLIEGIPQLVWRARPDGACTWASPQWLDYTGQNENEVIGAGWAAVVHPDDVERTLAAVAAARADGRLDVEARLRRADGAYLWHHVRSAPRFDTEGGIVEWLGTCTDVQQLKALQEQQQVLVAELQHRTRNLIAVVRAIADRTIAGSASMPDFRERFRDRMAALARVQGLLSQRDGGRRVTFDQLLHAELGGLGVLDRGTQLELDGPYGIGLRSSTVQTFALALHELATNAVKYGALATPQGRLHVAWSMERTPGEPPVLCVDWRESGVAIPPDRREAGARRGYGRELIERALPYQLQARTSYEIGEDGVHCSIHVPLGEPQAQVDD